MVWPHSRGFPAKAATLDIFHKVAQPKYGPAPKGRANAKEMKMGLKQISVFLENSPGRLYDITTAFGEAGINLKALSLVGASGFGVLRLLVSDIQKARKIAMEHHWPARVDDVVAVRIPDTPGSLSKLLGPLRDSKIDIEYMYAFTGFSSSEAVMIFGFKDQKRARKKLEAIGAVLVGAEEFGALEDENGS